MQTPIAVQLVELTYRKGMNSAYHSVVQKHQLPNKIGVAAKNAKRCFLTVIQKKDVVRLVEATWQIIRFFTCYHTMFQEHQLHKRIGDFAINAKQCFTTDTLRKGVVQQVEAM